MKYIKRDVLIILVMLLTVLNGCFSSVRNENGITASFSETGEKFYSSNLNLLFNFINEGNISQAEKIADTLSDISLPAEYSKLLSLASGVILLEKEDYENAERFFSAALPLTEAVTGLVYCDLFLRNPSQLAEAEMLLPGIPDDFTSTILRSFTPVLVKSLEASVLFWNGNDTEYEEVLKQCEKESYSGTNALVDRIIAEINENSVRLSEDLPED